MSYSKIEVEVLHTPRERKASIDLAEDEKLQETTRASTVEKNVKKGLTTKAQKFIRGTAIRAVEKLLASQAVQIESILLEKNPKKLLNKLLEAVEMLDREIGGLLGNPGSPYMEPFRNCQLGIFPGGAKTLPAKDIITCLNSNIVTVERLGAPCHLAIPKELKNPEIGIARILGKILATKLFNIRGEFLKIIATKDEMLSDKWQVNITANNLALYAIESYMPNAQKTPARKHKQKEPDEYMGVPIDPLSIPATPIPIQTNHSLKMTNTLPLIITPLIFFKHGFHSPQAIKCRNSTTFVEQIIGHRNQECLAL